MHYVTLRLAYADQPWAGQSSVTPQIPKMKAERSCLLRCTSSYQSLLTRLGHLPRRKANTTESGRRSNGIEDVELCNRWL
mmetsp:Transcript_35718/g.81945  ORF Transcript_35718/g.81945 Transcript_35718/m.81945 type:complete len:80 (-) Transcript_35718:970-1209(-)